MKRTRDDEHAVLLLPPELALPLSLRFRLVQRTLDLHTHHDSTVRRHDSSLFLVRSRHYPSFAMHTTCSIPRSK